MHPSAAFPLRGVIIRRLAAALNELGHHVEVAELGIGSPWRYLLARRRIARAIEKLAPDVVHVHFGYSGLAVPYTSTPVVTSFYGDDLHGAWKHQGGTSFRSKLGILVSQFVALRSSHCVVVSGTLLARLWFGAARRKTTVVRDAVDPRLFRPLPRDEARARLGLSANAVLIIFPHDATQPTKRLWLAEAAVAALKTTKPNAQLWVVNGKTPDEMPWYYAAADVMIITSVLESGPSSAKEALACGIPVVSVPVGDTQLFDEASAGMILAQPTPHALADGLARGLAIGEVGRSSWLPRHLTLQHATKQLTDLYQAVIAQG